eukprot:5610666-Amphidinium_carterae.4
MRLTSSSMNRVKSIFALADIHVCHVPGADGVLQLGEPYAHVHGVSCAPTNGASPPSTLGSPSDEIWEDNYDCSSYGDSRYAQWSSSIASTPGVAEGRPAEWYIIYICNVWNGDGPYRWTWSPAEDTGSESGRDCAEKDVASSGDRCAMRDVFPLRYDKCDRGDECGFVLTGCMVGNCTRQATIVSGVGHCLIAMKSKRDSVICVELEWTHNDCKVCCGMVSTVAAWVVVFLVSYSVIKHVCICDGCYGKGDVYQQWHVGGTTGHGLTASNVVADGRCMYRSIAVSQGLDEGRWKEVVADMLEHMQSGRWDAVMTPEISEHAIVCARRVLRHGTLPIPFWPTEPHLHAYAQAKGVYLRVWNDAAGTGKQWHTYGEEGSCVSLLYNGVDHYDALVREGPQVTRGAVALPGAAAEGSGDKLIGRCDASVKKRKSLWCLVTINVSSWKQAGLYLDYIRSGEAGYEPDVLSRSGYRVAFQSARRAEKSGRACGGTLIAVKARYGVRCEQHELTGHRHVSCVLNGIVPGGIRLISLYQEVGPGAEERRSEALHRCLQKALEDVRPFIIGADFNEEAAEVMGGLPQSPQWGIWKGNQPTCVGCGVSEIDYFMGHRSLAQLWICTQVDMLAPMSPHRPVVAWLQGTRTPERISVLKEHGKFPLKVPAGCVSCEYEQRLVGLAQRDLNDLWCEWNESAELQLCALHDIDGLLRKRYLG